MREAARLPRKRPPRPDRRAEAFRDRFWHAVECTPAYAWTSERNFAGLWDGIVDAAVDYDRHQKRSGRALSGDDEIPIPNWVISGLLDYKRHVREVFPEAIRDEVKLHTLDPRLRRSTLETLLEYLRRTVDRFRIKKIGRHARWTEWYQQQIVDFARFDAVHGLHFQRGLTWPEAYREASNIISGLAGGPPATIEDSYKRVRKALNEGALGRYYYSERIGIRGFVPPSP